ncbi:family 43 glycosylhydrolase [Allorhizocola rhizosphaerae]|uniref:family 43 glycosylhydrolase n=1 Tax=Allorhizocola rhizosphaerae TaxID=1872709 RepID=UPI000E3CDE93|nr:family 43 glycosylhydrolase [Allorhizocola rhizosphaerae]
MRLSARRFWTAFAVLATTAAGSVASLAPARGQQQQAAQSTAVTRNPASGFRNPASGFRNPVKESGADPFMVTHQGHYYLTYTRNDHIAITKAASVTELATAPETVVWRDTTASRCCALWAPEMHLLRGKWYIYYTATDSSHAVANHRMYVLESAGTDPLGPYSFKGALAAAADHYSIDGTVLSMPDGRLYAIWSGWQPGTTGPQNLYIAPMSNPWTTSGPRVLLSRPQYAWESDHAAVNEGAAALWRGGRLFLAYSASGCTSPNYALGLLTFRGDDVLNPAAWSKSPEPVFRASAANSAYTTAHNSFFTSPDGTQTWMAYHGVTNPSGSCGGDRATRLQKVNWRADGTPDFGVPVSTSATLALPSGDPGAQPLPPGDYVLTAGHSGKVLDVAWASTSDGADVLQWEYLGAANQKWRLRVLSDGSYQLHAVHSGKLLDVADASDVDGANVLQWQSNDGLNQQWYIDALGGGWYRISSKIGGRALDVDHAGADNGANVLVWQYLYATNQKWRLRPVTAG